jgi:hypothetical protein
MYLLPFTRYSDTFKTGLEVVLAAFWRPVSERTSLFDSSTPISFRRSEFFVLVTVQKLIKCVDLALNLVFRFQNLVLSGVLMHAC